MTQTGIFERSSCPVAVTLDIVGDKWTLIMIRDLMRGVTRFNEFLESPERIPTNILAARLKRLEQCGLINKRAYQDNPTRYEYLLTEKGLALGPILQEMSRWAIAFYPGAMVPSEKLTCKKIR